MRNDFTSGYLAHHGILGMKWGKKNGPPYPLGASDHSQSEKKAGYRKSLGGGRNEELYDRKDKKKNATSIKAAGHKALAKVYEINEKTYKKSNKTLSSMNAAAKKQQLKKAEEAQKEANKKYAEKKKAADEKKVKETEVKKQLSDVNPELAKNKQTKRVAYDYHNMTDWQFKAKYKTSRKKFQKRYVKSKGDTYGMGKRKALMATALIGSMPAQSVYVGKGRRLVVSGKAAAAKSLMYDFGGAQIKTNLGYKKAEEEYKRTKKG